MSKEWIIEVLGDLHGFASANALPQLAAQLEEARVVAIVEITQPAAAPADTRPDATQAGRPLGGPR
jgi:hypothetical protein